ncbi:hypothetical protein ERJ75_001212100 [Trypanosoma vivax]|nr:hypothetical protein ERJ75_001212100 [Trypanosoma vivax]
MGVWGGWPGAKRYEAASITKDRPARPVDSRQVIRRSCVCPAVVGKFASKSAVDVWYVCEAVLPNPEEEDLLGASAAEEKDGEDAKVRRCVAVMFEKLFYGL